jgi:hypothetical protein
MKKSKFVAIILATAVIVSLALATLSNSASAATCDGPCPLVGGGRVFGGATPWWMFVCPGGIVTAAVVKNARRNRELTTQEAWTCGFLYWWNEGTGVYGR